ncbi:MAG: hypothetical protein KGL39_37460 [Patescibacteria group bacterium]|nr:hypothetical protein [Patescibacteria group bacterium]
MKAYYVLVCEKCLRASCFHGIFMCDDAATAGIVEKRSDELDELRKEHRSYYSAENVFLNTGRRVRFVE